MSNQTRVSSGVDENDFEVADGILSRWDCSTQEKCVILSIDHSQYDALLSAGSSVSFDSEQLERINHIVRIDESLRRTFNNPQNIDGFMRMKNNNNYFCGRTPLDVILSGGLVDLATVRRRVVPRF
jgi:hypothetical protein